MTTVAYAAVTQSGLSFDRQLWMRPEIIPGLRRLTDAIHAEGAAAGIQLGHCGNMSDGAFPGHMLSKAAERMVRLRKVNGPKVTGVNNLDSIVMSYEL